MRILRKKFGDVMSAFTCIYLASKIEGHYVSQPADLKSKVYIVKYDLICLRMFATFFDGHIWHFS